MAININCDMGEGFGLYTMGDDEGIAPYVTEMNVACGFHASDPNHMRKTVELAKRHGVKIGAHVSLPDLQGFGRREMKIAREELVNIIIYQVGALKGFLEVAGMPLNHLKPHGALYGMAARQEEVAEAVADACEMFGVPLFGMAGTLHEEVSRRRGIAFRAEFFSDLNYDASGRLIITRVHEPVDPQVAVARCLRAVKEGRVTAVDGTELPVRAETVCVHSDTPNAVAVARAIREALDPFIERM